MANVLSSGSSLSESNLPPTLRHYAQYVNSPYLSWGLSGCFLASVPFTFLPPSLAAQQPPPPPPQPANDTLLKRLARGNPALKQSFNPRTGLPPAYQVLGFSALIGLGGYGIHSGDVLNGTGIVTGWSALYLAFYSLRTLKTKHPVSIGLTAATAAIGGLHGAYYFDRTSWQGAFPGMTKSGKQHQVDSYLPGGSSHVPIHAPIHAPGASSQALPAYVNPAIALLAVGAAAGSSRRARSSILNMFKRNSSTATNANAPTSKASRFVRPIDPSTIPKGFAVSSAYAGIKAAISPKPTPDAGATGAVKTQQKPDLALIVSTTDKPAAAAGTFTRNVFKAAPVVLSSQVLLSGAQSSAGARARSILVNSGCANAVTGQRGLDDARRCGSEVGKLLKRSETETLLLSTGVIGVPLPMDAISKQLPHLANGLVSGDADQWHQVSRAFMTTDTFPKLRSRVFKLAGKECRLLGIDKGAGMIHPSMAGPASTGGLHATLLGVVATDAPIAPAALQSALDYAVERSFNCISVDGDMSTNDTIIALANGAAGEGGKEITAENDPQEYATFKEELRSFCTELAQLIVRDGEGAEKFVEIRVKNAATHAHAHSIASSISTSALVKCALHGGDANWGRILCAVGYAPLPPASTSSSASSAQWNIDPSKVTVKFLPPPNAPSSLSSSEEYKPLTVLKNGAPQAVNEEEAGRLLALEDIIVEVDLQGGVWVGQQTQGAKADQEATYWTCDFSKEYVAINGDYRS